MADRFLNSVDGSDSNGGTSWSDEKLTLGTGIAAIDAAGDRVLIDTAHSGTEATINYTSPGTPANPIQFLSVTPTGASGISSLTAGADIICSGTTFNILGSLYAYGITWRSTTASSVVIQFSALNGDVQRHDSCNFEVTGAGGSTTIFFGGTTTGGGAAVELRDCTFKLGAAAQRIEYATHLAIRGGSWQSGGTAPTALFKQIDGLRGGLLLVEGTDFTNAGTAVNLHSTGQGGVRAVFRDIIMAASWTGVPIADASLREGMEVEVWNYRIGSTYHRFWLKNSRCQLTPETTIVRTGGASDDVGSYSVKMVTTANVAYPSTAARSMELVAPNSTTGSNVTITCEIIHDSVTALDDDEIWLEVEEPDGTVTTDAMASVIATPAAQTSSSETWTTTGLTNPNKQALSVTINPSRAGNLLCRVVCAKPSKTLYICPKLTVA